MSKILSRVWEPVKRKGAERYMQLTLLSFAGSVSLTRLFLGLTGFPQLGNDALHIAHVLYGGVMLFVSSLLPLIYANRWAYTWGSILSGVGVGLFIDEVGKFITQSNDYFYPPAAPIIYASFLITVLVYSRVRGPLPRDPRTELYAVLESLEDVIDHDLDVEEHRELRERLTRIVDSTENRALREMAGHLLDFVDSNALKVAPDEPGFVDRAISWFSAVEDRWIRESWLRTAIAIGLGLMGLVGLMRLLDLALAAGDPVALEALLLRRVSELPATSSRALFWAIIQVVLEGAVGVTLLAGSLLLILGFDRPGLGLGSLGLVVSLVGVNLILFYLNQFSTILIALVQFSLLQGVYYYQRRFA